MYSPHHVTMHFDLTDPEGRTAFEYARLGQSAHTVLWDLWKEMFDYVNDERLTKPDQITQQWLERLLETMDDYNVPLEVG